MRVGQNIGLKRILEIDTHKVTELGLSETILASSIDEVLNDEDISIVVELIGGIEPARTFILECMKKGKHVVTANKDLIAVCGEELFQTAEEYQVNFYFEASVGGGIPSSIL